MQQELNLFVCITQAKCNKSSICLYVDMNLQYCGMKPAYEALTWLTLMVHTIYYWYELGIVKVKNDVNVNVRIYSYVLHNIENN